MAIARNTTLVDYVIPPQSARSVNLLKDGLLVIGFSLFLALCAQLSIKLSANWVPITGQTLGVLLTGAALGSRRGSLAMLVYLAEGAAGLPFFAGGAGGYLVFVGPTAGYLFSFPLVAFVVGWLCERSLDRSYSTSVLAMLPASLIIYICGFLWLAGWYFVSHITPGINLSKAFVSGVIPFIPGDLIKLVIAALLLPSAWAIIRSVRGERY
jgi:biotin transport system substrate-specific component